MKIPLLNRLASVVRTRHDLADLRSRMLVLYNFLLRELRTFWLPWRNRIVVIRHRATEQPITLRLGSTDWYVIQEIFQDGDYDFVKQWPTSSFKTILDLGANAGFSVLFWKSIAPDASVKAVEPDRNNLDICCANCKRDRSVTLHHAFVGGQAGRSDLNRSGGEWGYSKGCAVSDAGGINVVTVEELLRATPHFESVDLLKCDIEGSEAEVFLLCGSWINKVRYLVVETHPPYTSERLCVDLAANGSLFGIEHLKTNGRNEVVFLRNQSASS